MDSGEARSEAEEVEEVEEEEEEGGSRAVAGDEDTR